MPSQTRLDPAMALSFPRQMTGILGRSRENSTASPANISRNVSFTTAVNNSSAHEAHNPPTLLRQQAAHTPVPEMPDLAQLCLSAKNKKHLDKREEIHILLGVTGSVATIKLPLIVQRLRQVYQKRAVIKIIVTQHSTTFIRTEELPKDVKIHHDEDEWRSRTGTSDNLHVQLRRWADILVVAPCSANTLAKFAYGVCDNLLTSVFRVWNPALPILLAPAMNTQMYLNPVTKRHDALIRSHYPHVEILKPVEKVLVCGDIGMGGMREWTDIVCTVTARLGVAVDDTSDESDTDDD